MLAAIFFSPTKFQDIFMALRFSCGPMGLACIDPDYRDAGPCVAPPAGWRALGAEDVRRLHVLYYDPAVPVSAIAPQFGVSGSTLLRWIAEMGWPSRRALRRQSCEALRTHGAALRGDPCHLPDDTGDDTEGGNLRREVEAALQRELAFMDSTFDADESELEARERSARTLYHLVRAMAGLRALERADGGDAPPEDDEADARPSRSIAELRDDLNARLERLWAGG